MYLLHTAFFIPYIILIRQNHQEYSESSLYNFPSIIIVRHLKKIMFVFVIMVLPILFIDFSFAEEETEDNQILISKLSLESPEETLINEFMESNGFSAGANNYSETYQTEFVYDESDVPEVKTEKLKKEDILSAVPSISTEDNKTLGLLIPPFAYFAKKF